MPNRFSGGEISENYPGEVRFVNDGESTPYLAKYDKDGNIIDEPFKVITTTDFHILDSGEDELLGYLDILIERDRPDLVVFLGDIILGADDTMQQRLKEYFDERRQHWTFVPGNHDGEEYFAPDRDELRRRWYESMLGGEYCIAFDEGGDDVYGFGNHAVNILTSRGVSSTLFFIDNSVDCYDEELRLSQAEWYEERVLEIREENGGEAVPGFMFMHRPLFEYELAYKALGTDESLLIYGDNKEKIEFDYYNLTLFDKIEELGATHTVICGHDHHNDTFIRYRGVNLVYSQGLRFAEAYSRTEWLRWHLYYLVRKECLWFNEGATEVMIFADGDYRIAPSYLPLEEYIPYLNLFKDR